MKNLALSALLLAASPSALLAQDALTPTDVLEFGQIAATGRLQATTLKATAVSAAIDLDLDSLSYQFVLEGAVGLGMGFELEAEIPYQFAGDTDGDGTILGLPATLDSEQSGFGDLQLRPIYRFLKEDASSPQLVLGLILVAPTGNDKDGEAEINSAALGFQPGEEGGIGSGVWSYGVMAGVSKKLGPVEPYLAGTFVWGGERDVDGVDEDRADVGTLLAGAELHLTEQARLDVRAFFQSVGKDITEDDAVKQEEEAHTQFGGQILLYIKLGGALTLVAGGSAVAVEDHEVDDTLLLDAEDAFYWTAQLGLHLFFGK
jgi:opacity protein-like surface antigen